MSELRPENCTKEELLWVINQLMTIGNVSNYVRRVMIDVQYKRGMKRIEKAKDLEEIMHEAHSEYEDIMKPYKGKRLRDIPDDVLKQADFALKRYEDANKEWGKLMLTDD